jgi:DNA-directed RNA polymerase specialized sigma24 family protein
VRRRRCAWLLRITANVCHNWQDGRFGTHRRRTVPLESLFDSLAEHAAIPTVESLEPVAFDLQSAVARLPPDLRQVVALRFFVGMNSTEIGAALEIPAGAGDPGRHCAHPPAARDGAPAPVARRRCRG